MAGRVAAARCLALAFALVFAFALPALAATTPSAAPALAPSPMAPSVKSPPTAHHPAAPPTLAPSPAAAAGPVPPLPVCTQDSCPGIPNSAPRFSCGTFHTPDLACATFLWMVDTGFNPNDPAGSNRILDYGSCNSGQAKCPKQVAYAVAATASACAPCSPFPADALNLFCTGSLQNQGSCTLSVWYADSPTLSSLVSVCASSLCPTPGNYTAVPPSPGASPSKVAVRSHPIALPLILLAAFLLLRL